PVGSDLRAPRARRDRLLDRRGHRLALLDLVVGFRRRISRASCGVIGVEIDEVLVDELLLAIAELLELLHAPKLPKSKRARRFPVEPMYRVCRSYIRSIRICQARNDGDLISEDLSG